MDENYIDFDMRQFGIRIENARNEQRLTRLELANLCNITDVHLRHIEGGNRLPSLPVFIMLCKALRVTANYFVADYIDLKNGIPDAYAKIVDVLLAADPQEAEKIIAMIETMERMTRK